jgi:hypothetical protein
MMKIQLAHRSEIVTENQVLTPDGVTGIAQSFA